ncbi:MAG: hypothetical protein E6Q99_08120 [Elusimicrobia bacterium]|jgi:type II secretory pathway component GspD/PulD (secretin)|nr:MAG: hypothetical protein E6Q99_08120 [Elusimicrobiota bacterium]
MFRCLFCLLLLAAGSVWGQQQLEVIPLRSQTVDKVLPVLLPLVEPGGSLSGMNNQLFLRASSRNRDEIKRALAAIDTPARRLIIRISQNRQAEVERRGASGSAQVTLGGTRRVEAGAQVWDTRSVRRDSGEQSVQTLEGASAFIQVGRSLPVPLRQVVIGPGGVVASETTVYRDVGQGFYAIPRLAGDRVTLDISQQADAAGAGGSVATQRLSTTVSGRLGEWIELGGGGRRATTGERGGISLSTQDVSESRSVWLLVEELP